MEFRLIYAGPLKSNRGAEDKQLIRRFLHPQLKKLWEQEPLKSDTYLFRTEEEQKPPNAPPGWKCSTATRCVGNFRFTSLISTALSLAAEIDILMLKPERPGNIVNRSGDIDNQLKTLLDALRSPLSTQELPNGDEPRDGETPFFCLLEDDKLITTLSIHTDQLLVPSISPNDVSLIIHVKTKFTHNSWQMRKIYL